jgi:hypothetical protein
MHNQKHYHHQQNNNNNYINYNNIQPIKRYNHISFIYKHKLYILGGFVGESVKSPLVDDIEKKNIIYIYGLGNSNINNNISYGNSNNSDKYDKSNEKK